jgi:uroporphyrinogen-III synthase
MRRTLQGIGVLVTRPAQQAGALCRLFEAEGAAVQRLPAIDIEPVAAPDALADRFGPLDAYQFVVFVSANAVRFGAYLLPPGTDLPLAAVGPATARALTDTGRRVTVVPEGGFDSESLLAHPAFDALQGRRVLLVRGVGGRDLLAAELERRGAAVEVAEVYRRRRARPDAAALACLERQFASGALTVITATSLEIGESLLAMATPALRAAWERVPWVVPGERVAAGLRQRGLGAPLLPAASAQDQDLVAAVVRWRSAVSGA